MRLSAVLTKNDLLRAIEEITPLDFEISRRPRRTISLGRPWHVELVADAGLRIAGSARLRWEIAGLVIPVTVRAWQILLVPFVAVRDGVHVLAFEPTLEHLDFKHIPGFLDERIVETVNEAIAAQRSKLVWNFSKTLAVHRALPDKLTPHRCFDLSPADGEVTVSTTEMALTIHIDANMAMSARRPA
ncbi:MAG: hypothetical protein FWD69_07690 [Polyangiaceae bacterium]|nr:hypothetical protein [Polyangiaceae bacterium]